MKSPQAKHADSGGGYSISYVPVTWERQLSGEVGGYSQALPEVVTL